MIWLGTSKVIASKPAPWTKVLLYGKRRGRTAGPKQDVLFCADILGSERNRWCSRFGKSELCLVLNGELKSRCEFKNNK